MLRQLAQTIAISQQVLADLRAPSTSLAIRSTTQTATLLSAFAAAGIPRIHDRRIADPLASKLHQATQQHFQQACEDLARVHHGMDPAALQHLALSVKDTFTTLYKRKVADIVSRPRRMTEKQPYANDILLYAFEQSPSPTKRERHVLSSLTGMTLEQVRVWFQNRRQRTKKRAPELLPRSSMQLDDVLARVAASKAAERADEYDDDSGYFSESDRDHSATPAWPQVPVALTVASTTPRSYPAPYTPQPLSPEFNCQPPVFGRLAAVQPPIHAQSSMAELTRLMSRLTLRHRRQTPRSSTGSTQSTISPSSASKSAAKSSKVVASGTRAASSSSETRTKTPPKDPKTGRKVAGRRGASAATTTPPASSISPSPSASLPSPSSALPAPDSTTPRKRLGPLRRKPAGKALARQASESSVASTSSSGSSRSSSYSSDFSLASDSSFTSVESAPTAASMECFQPPQQLQFDPLAAFDFTQLFSSQPSDPLPQPVADFELPPDLLAGLQMPMDTAALPPPESTDFLALLNDPTIQDLLQSVQDMDVVAPQQTQESLTFNNTLDVGSVDTSGFLNLGASTLPTFDAMFGLDASSFQDILWNSPGFSLPITA